MSAFSCNKNDEGQYYSVLNTLINSRSEDILDKRFFIERKINTSLDTSDVGEYLDYVNKFSTSERKYMMDQLISIKIKVLEKSKLTNKNIEMVNNFTPSSIDYYLKYSIPIFSKNRKYCYIREYTYYWGDDAVTNYLMRQDSSGWHLYLMDHWKFGGAYKK